MKHSMLIFGGTGSLGHALVERYKSDYHIVIFSRDENKQWAMRKQFPHISFVIGDIRDKNAVETAIAHNRPEIVIIAAALKHIDICENNTAECIKTNVDGVQNVIDVIYNNALAGRSGALEKVLFVSTDKACAPVNAYGMCKALAERIVIEKSQVLTKPKFLVARYGNVINSRGSLFPLFREIGADANRKEFLLTDRRMTRFFMTLKDSVKLINDALEHGESGDTYIPKIRSYNIADIAAMFSKKYNKPVRVNGLRPGEKLHEVLINETERSRVLSMGDNFVIKPCYRNITSNLVLSILTSDLLISPADELTQYI